MFFPLKKQFTVETPNHLSIELDEHFNTVRVWESEGHAAMGNDPLYSQSFDTYDQAEACHQCVVMTLQAVGYFH